MTASAHSLIVFDWDGTLMDSAGKIVACFQSAAHDLGFPVPGAALIEHQIGLTLEIAWSHIMAGLDVSKTPALLQHASDRYRDYFLEIDTTPMPLYAGVEQGLRELDEAGFLLAVATGKARRGLQRALRDTDLHAHFVYTRCADESRSKPHPQMLLDTLDFCGCEPEQALMVGDTTYDMHMARNAGVDAMAVSYGVHPAEHLVPLANMGCARSFSEVVDTIRRAGS